MASRPKVFIAAKGDFRALLVLGQLERWVRGDERFKGIEVDFVPLDEDDILDYLAQVAREGVTPDVMVVLFSCETYYRRWFQLIDFDRNQVNRPTWAGGVRWGVAIGRAAVGGAAYPANDPLSIVHQVANIFLGGSHEKEMAQVSLRSGR